MQNLYNDRWLAFETYEELTKHAEEQQHYAMINENDFMTEYYGSTSCEFFPVSKLLIQEIAIVMLAQKNSPFTAIINHQYELIKIQVI